MNCLSLITAGLLSLTLAGCCECSIDAPVEDIKLRFSTDSLGGTGFTKAEVQSAYLVRYAGPDLTQVVDTLWQRPTSQRPDAPLFQVQYTKLSQEFSFWARSPRGGLSADNSFQVLVPAAGRFYTLTDLDIKVSSSAIGLCDCPRLDRLKLKVNGHQVDARNQIPALVR